MSAMLAQRRRAAASKAAALAVKAGASAYAASEKGGGLTYGEVDAEDLLKCVNTFCAPLPAGGFWDLGSGAGGAALAAAPVTYSTAWRCGSLTACLDGAKKGC